MAGETKPETKATAKAEAPKKVRKFEAMSQINLGGGNIKRAGETVLETEVKNPADLAALIASGRLVDGDAPIPPSKAEGQVAFDRLSRIAGKLGLVKRDGAEYRFAGATYQGLAAFREAVTLDELEAAIVAKAKG